MNIIDLFGFRSGCVRVLIFLPALPEIPCFRMDAILFSGGNSCVPLVASERSSNVKFPFFQKAEFLRPFGSKRPKVERGNSAELRFIVYRTQTILYSQCVTSLECHPHYTHHTTAVCREALLRYQHSRRHFC